MDKQLWIRRIGLMIYDVFAVIVASYTALLVRFDFELSAIPESYKTIMLQVLPFTLIGTVVIFYLFHMYSSLWIYASVTELVNVVGASVTVGFMNLLLIFCDNREKMTPMPRSFYAIFTIVLMILVAISRFSYRVPPCSPGP